MTSRRTRRFFRRHKHWLILAAVPVVVFVALWGLSELAWHFNPTFPE